MKFFPDFVRKLKYFHLGQTDLPEGKHLVFFFFFFSVVYQVRNLKYGGNKKALGIQD